MANKNVTKKEIIDSFAKKAEDAIQERRKESKGENLGEKMEHNTLVEALTSAVINDVFEQYVKRLKYNRFSMRPGDMFKVEETTYTVADVIEPFHGEVILVYFETLESGERVYSCKKFATGNEN